MEIPERDWIEAGLFFTFFGLDAIRKAEDRDAFRSLMKEIGEPVPESWIIESEKELETLARRET